MKTPTPLSRIAALLSATLLSGCAVGPDYVRPFFELPTSWFATKAEPTETVKLRKADTASERWWSLYADPTLDRLIDEALQHNADAAVAAARVLEVRAILRITDSDLYPNVSAGISGSRSQNSLVGAIPRSASQPRIQNNTRATIDASYEIDFWGKYRRASEAARAELLAAESSREAVRLSLTAQVAQEYFALIAADAAVAITERTLQSRKETLDLFVKRFEAGTLSEYDLRQTEAEEAATRSQLAGRIQQRDRGESALALLLGRSPREVMSGNIERAAPKADERSKVIEIIIPSGLPSDLLLRRPDLREAEAGLIAANARIGAARAQYFPSIGLTANLGSESSQFSNLFTGPAGIFQFAAAITQPIWNAGRIGANVDASEARRNQSLAQYRKAVASAFKDVRDALAAQKAAHDTLDAESTRVTALGKALELARLRFDAGITSHLDVLDVERNLLAAEIARADAERASKAALADTFKALGGGWTSPETETQPALANAND